MNTISDMDPAVLELAAGRIVDKTDELRVLLNHILNSGRSTPLLSYLAGKIKEDAYFIRTEVNKLVEEARKE